MESTVVIALITALAAIFAPLITALINSRNTLKIKKTEARQEMLKSINLHEREVLENALAGIGTLMGRPDLECYREAAKDILTAVAYVDLETGELIRDIVKTYSAKENVTIKQYSELCAALKQEISKRTEEYLN